MKSEGWRGKTKQPVALWKLEARRGARIAVSKSYSMGGLPRRRKPAAITLPKLRCQEPS